MIFKVYTQYKWIVRAKLWILCAKVGSRGKIFPTVWGCQNPIQLLKNLEFGHNLSLSLSADLCIHFCWLS